MGDFQNITGLKYVKSYLQKAIELDRISHAYIFSADQGCGKRTMAMAFAKALQCERQELDACGECTSCRQAESNNHPDIIWVTHEKPNTISIDEIREQVNRTVPVKPYRGKYKIYIIPDAQMMTLQAQNAILKTIEEPPEYVVILLLTSNETQLLPTIHSRCVMLRFRPIKTELVKNYLMEHFEIPDYKADICAAFGQGNIGKAIRLATDEKFEAMKDEALALVKSCKDMRIPDLIDSMKQLTEYKINIDDYLDFVMVWYRDVLLFKATRDLNGVIFKEETSTIMRQADTCAYDGIESIIKALGVAKERLAANVSFELTMELLFLTIKENS